MTSKLTITRERLQEIAEDGFLKHGESKILARMALAAMDSEPVAYMWDSKRNDIDAPGFYFPEHLFFAESNVKQWGGEVIPLYRHAQLAPVVPDRITPESDIICRVKPEGIILNNRERHIAAEVWNACRAAMLQAGNSPVIPEWIPVSEQMPKRGDYLVTDGRDFDVQTFDGEQFIPGFVWDDVITHWMPLPAAPQEAK
ncbi:DUF551 domain-containing protein [Klebsiella grimontii]|uniref:DUF551 domain-containing protein n=1 Tax=Klebsiella TaxID=570 RepID=UPI000BF08926|nr:MULTISPECIES: DUF551 domain-containing protein [Klebsiella]KAA0493945.1 DUF551 domain-containing protein [Klebsiella grimontii]PEN25005.1 hypothetical protein CMQ96_07145 [Klebsiella sp. MBT K-1]